MYMHAGAQVNCGSQFFQIGSRDGLGMSDLNIFLPPLWSEL